MPRERAVRRSVTIEEGGALRERLRAGSSRLTVNEPGSYKGLGSVRRAEEGDFEGWAEG